MSRALWLKARRWLCTRTLMSRRCTLSVFRLSAHVNMVRQIRRSIVTTVHSPKWMPMFTPLSRRLSSLPINATNTIARPGVSIIAENTIALPLNRAACWQ